ncbi:MAG: hypothetical protein ACLR17_05620 [Enterobacteriaceae bacterium]
MFITGAQLPECTMNMRRVITKAIHRSSKPDWRLVAMEAGRRGVDAIPTLLKKCSLACYGWRADARISAGRCSLFLPGYPGRSSSAYPQLRLNKMKRI